MNGKIIERRIPKILHQTWKDEYVPMFLAELSQTWRSIHPDWEYILWTDKMNFQFVEKYYPEFMDIYLSYPNEIMRVDAVRYLILLKMGGLFVDLDYVCYKNFEEILSDVDLVFGEEPSEHCILHNKQLIISNSLMASVSGSNLLNNIYLKLCEGYSMSNDKNLTVLESTGPFMLTEFFMTGKFTDSFTLLNSDLVSPLDKEEMREFIEGEIIPKNEKAYAQHFYLGSWWKNK